MKRWLCSNQLNIVAELDGAGNVVSRFVYGTRPNVPDYLIKGGVTYRIVSDHLGSVRLVVNTTNGTVAQWLDYDEFGNITNDTNAGFQPFGFAGGLYDEQTKLVRFGARDYDAFTGRWTAKDPILFDGGQTNIYVYVGNNPVNFIDPMGLDSRLCSRYTPKSTELPVVVVAFARKELIKVHPGNLTERTMEITIPENAVIIGPSQATPAGTDWDFVRINGAWHKFPVDAVLTEQGRLEPATVVDAISEATMKAATGGNKSIRPASEEKGEISGSEGILRRMIERRKAMGRGEGENALQRCTDPCP